MKTFGQRLKDSRKNAKLSQSEVARRVGMSQSLLSELENDEYPTSGFTIQLAALYRVNPLWLADGVGLRDPSSSEEAVRLNTLYNQLSKSDQELIKILLSPEKTPEWLSPAAKSAIESAREIIAEQMPKK